jgi:hypothetical protein
MADINWANYSVTTKTISTNSDGSVWLVTQGNIGTAAEVYDENEATYLERYTTADRILFQEPVYCQAVATVIGLFEFPMPITLHEIKAVLQGVWTVVWDDSPYNWQWDTIEYYDGSWHYLDNQHALARDTKTTRDFIETHTNVTKVRVTISSSAGGEGGGVNSSAAQAYLFEVYIYGLPPHKDIGGRIRASTSTIKIGVQDLEATHKVRIRKGNTTYGLKLLATNDPEASGLRIYDGTAVKSLPLVT